MASPLEVRIPGHEVDEPDAGPPDDAWWRTGGLSLSGRGIQVEGSDGDWRLRVGGRLHLDSVAFDDDRTPFSNDTNFRRLRVYVAARWKDLRARVERDFGGTIRGWKSLYVRYLVTKALRITGGNQIPPFSLEENTSSNRIPFLERSLSNSLSPGFLTGVAASMKGDRWALGLGYFGNTFGNEPKRRSRGDGWYFRGTWAPVKEEDSLVHVGASLEVRNIDAGTRYRVRSRPESGLATSRLLDTRSIKDVRNTLTWGVESILRRDRLTLQGEYLMSHLDRQSTDATFQGWNARAGWLLRGGQRDYRVRSGSLGSLVSPDGWGALEISARISSLDLNDADITGGSGTNYSLGVDWTLNENVRILAEGILSEADPNRDGLDEELRLVQVRLQFAL